MGFFKALFSSKTTVTGLQRAVEQKRYADARYLAQELEGSALNSAETELVADLNRRAGDGLARLNLMEARAKQGSGSREEAEQHFRLALEYVESPELRTDIELARGSGEAENVAPVAAPGSGCGSCGSVSGNVEGRVEPLEIEAEIRMELILTSYPENIRERYLNQSSTFIEAFLLAHEGDDVQALTLFKKIKDSEKDDLYWFELGSLLAREGHLKDAQRALETAHELNPEWQFILEALVEVLLAEGHASVALPLVMAKLDHRRENLYRHHLAMMIHAREGRFEQAADHVVAAGAGGYENPAFFLQAAGVMERLGRMDEAENLLLRLNGGGCKKTTNVHLAEFYLRHGRELEKVFTAFRAALKQEPDNPRWKLLLARTCFARDWNKDGRALLNQLVSDPNASSEVQEEARLLEARYGG